MKKIAVILVISFFVTFAALPLGLLADGGSALTISYAYSDVGFSVYRVAEEVNGQYQFTKDFEGCGADLDVKYNSEREALISALSAYVKANAVAPTASGRTDSAGKLIFDGLMNGMYLILGERSEDSTQYHFPAESLATLTGDLTVEIKHDDVDKPVIPPITTFVTVTKTWDVPEGTETPDSVTVDLLRDGEVYNTVKLDESNNWTHIWSKLAPGHDWTVRETDVPDGYTSSIERIGTTFRITNTLTTDTSNDDASTDDTSDTTAPNTDTDTTTDTTDTTDTTTDTDNITDTDTTRPDSEETSGPSTDTTAPSDDTRHEDTTGPSDDTTNTETNGPSDDTNRPDADETSPDMKPDDPKPPKTGDDIALWVLIFVLSAALTATMAVIAYRRVRTHR